VVTTLLDSAGGAAVFSMLALPSSIATLDLRIDYLRPSTPAAPLYARVECYKLTRSVAFTRGTAYNHDPSDPVASMAATFMLNTQALPHASAERGDG
jgi:acyl-coenzyme A thioesterase PaaI-like protein